MEPSEARRASAGGRRTARARGGTAAREHRRGVGPLGAGRELLGVSRSRRNRGPAPSARGRGLSQLRRAGSANRACHVKRRLPAATGVLAHQPGSGRGRERDRGRRAIGRGIRPWPAVFRGAGGRYDGSAAGGGAQAGHAQRTPARRSLHLRIARRAERRGCADRRPHQLQHPDRRHPLQLSLQERSSDPDAAARAVRGRRGGFRGDLAGGSRHPAVRGDRPAAARAVRLHRDRRLDRGDGRPHPAQLPAGVLPAGGLPRAALEHPARGQCPLPDAVLHRAQGVQPDSRPACSTPCRSAAASRSPSPTGSRTWASSTG